MPQIEASDDSPWRTASDSTKGSANFPVAPEATKFPDHAGRPNDGVLNLGPPGWWVAVDSFISRVSLHSFFWRTLVFCFRVEITSWCDWCSWWFWGSVVVGCWWFCCWLCIYVPIEMMMLMMRNVECGSRYNRFTHHLRMWTSEGSGHRLRFEVILVKIASCFAVWVVHIGLCGEIPVIIDPCESKEFCVPFNFGNKTPIDP